MMQETTIQEINSIVPAVGDDGTHRLSMRDATGNVHLVDLDLDTRRFRFVHPCGKQPLKYQPIIWCVEIPGQGGGIYHLAFDHSFKEATVFCKKLTAPGLFMGPFPLIWESDIAPTSKGPGFFDAFVLKHEITEIDFDTNADGMTVSLKLDGEDKRFSLAQAAEVVFSPRLWMDPFGKYYGYGSGIFNVGTFGGLGNFISTAGPPTEVGSTAFTLFSDASSRKFEGCQEEDGSLSLLRRDLRLSGSSKCPLITNAKVIKSLLETAPLSDPTLTEGIDGAEVKAARLICELDEENSLVAVGTIRTMLQIAMEGCGNGIVRLVWYLVVFPIYYVLLAVVLAMTYGLPAVVILLCGYLYISSP